MARFSRAQWGARRPKATTPKPWSQIDTIVIHYSAAASDLMPDYAARVRGIQNYHMNTQGWNDIAYNWIVARNGDIFEGRGWNNRSGATGNANSHTFAICFLGNDNPGRDDVTDAGRKAIQTLVAEARQLSGKKLMLRGHRDFMSTSCPGDELYAALRNGGLEPQVRQTYPRHFFKWAAWWLGEKPFDVVGPRHKPSRPAKPSLPVSTLYWLALKRFIRARKKD